MNEILLTTLIVTIFSGILAFLLTLANNTIGNYGEKKIIINGEEELDIQAGDTLLSTLISEKIFIPSACGGKGTCGYCKVKVLEGGGPILPTELPWLSKEEQEDNIRLSCQCKVKEDMKIEIPEELFNVKEYEAKVEILEDMTDEIKHLRLSFKPGESINFKPGQYIQLKAPIYEGNDEEVYRAYSIASAPKDKHYIDLLIGYVPGGICTTYVHKHLKVGDTVNINGPYGDFYYQDNIKNDMIMVAVGTGMAPILSILEYMKDNEIKRSAKFYFGAKTPDDLFLLNKMADFEKELYDFEFIPTLSRVIDEHNWTGEKGRVNLILDKHIKDSTDKEAYLCGSPGMIDSVTEVLNEKGILPEYIFYDKF